MGAITNRLRKSASPITTWFGGIAGKPSALRVSESTITMRVKLVNMTSSAGATASTVSNRMITMLCDGLFLPVPSGDGMSMLIDALCASAVVGGVTTGIETEGGVGVPTAGAFGVVGAAPAAVNDALSHEHASARNGSAASTRRRRRHATRRGGRMDTDERDVGTETLFGVRMLSAVRCGSASGRASSSMPS